MNYPSVYQFDGIDPQKTLSIVAPGNLEDMLSYTRSYKKLKIDYIFDPGQSIPAWSGDQLVEMLTGSSLFISNDYELEMMMQATGLDKGELLGRTKTIITTLGENGSLVCTHQYEVAIPAAQGSRVLDPTGAGDAYRAGLIKGLVMGKNLEDAARMGAVCATYVIECHGTQEHRFLQEEFWARYQANFASTSRTSS